jgi:arylsulfatase A-like enzyme
VKLVLRSAVSALWLVVLSLPAASCDRSAAAGSRRGAGPAGATAPSETFIPGIPASPPRAGGPGRVVHSRDLPDILLISIDTLRADHLSANGHARPTTPFIDSLARDGIRYARAYSTSSWTVPSLASMVTSTYPERHGMDQNRRRGRHVAVLPAALATLAEVLARAGYRTFGVTANFGLLDEQGFGRGFHRFASPGPIGSEQVEPILQGWLPEIREARPWFVWLHLFDPHAPYLAREPWLTELWPPNRPRHTGFDGTGVHTRPRLSPDQADYVRTLYDSEIRHMDERLRAMVGRIPRAESALVIVTADHGEEFLERGWVGHGRTLFDESVRVPMIVRLPGRDHAGTVSEAPVSLVDVLPTALAVAGLPSHAGAAGISLADPRAVPEHRTLFARVVSVKALRAAIDRRFKLVIEVADPTRGQLHDLASDPGERADVARALPADAARLMRAIEDHVLATHEGRPVPTLAEITPVEEAQVRALGYVQ